MENLLNLPDEAYFLFLLTFLNRYAIHIKAQELKITYFTEREGCKNEENYCFSNRFVVCIGNDYVGDGSKKSVGKKSN